MNNQINLTANGLLDERQAGESGIYPGMLLAINSSGNVVKHPTIGGFAAKRFAQEESLLGGTVNTVYANGAKVRNTTFVAGGKIQALLKAGFVYLKGDDLVSGGDGTLIPLESVDSAVDVKDVVATCDVALDISDSTDVNTLAAVIVR